MEEKVKKALELIHSYGGIDGNHHKQWLLNEVVKELSDDYSAWVKNYCDGEDGENTYAWDEGIAP
jgi:hypothetical protein